MARKAAAGNDSRERMLEAAITLMRGSGLSGAGINEIVRESGAPKGSVYHFFPDGKLSLVAEALTIYSQRVRDFIDAALASRRMPEDKIRVLFAAFAKRIEEADYFKSCAVGAISLDLDEDVAGLQAVLAGAFADWIDCIATHFELGDAKRTRSFASLVLTTVEGAYVRCRAERSKRPFIEAGEWLAELAKR
jgi:AcrR family transcriptional regulator